MTELTGQVLGGRYRVEAFIGQGGMADVYKVRDLQRAVFLAMKILHADLSEDAVFIRNFEREAQMLERLQHPNIVRFYGFEKTPELAFILMDFIDGLTLRREIFLYKNGLRTGRVLEIMQPVCAALYYAHQMGMIHCDIKPANIITHRNGTIYLTDFGISRQAESNTQPLTGVGSPAYMAPEQFDGKEPTQAVDIYSLGVVMYEMLTGGQRPFTGESGRASGSTTKRIVWEKKHLQPPSPRVYNSEITPELEAVVMTCLQHNPRRRFRSPLDLLQALEIAVRGVQPEDDAQTRVDLPKGGRTARAASEKTALKSEKPDAEEAGLRSAGTDKPTPAERPVPKEKAPSTVKVEPGGKSLLPPVRPAATASSPVARKPETGEKPTATERSISGEKSASIDKPASGAAAKGSTAGQSAVINAAAVSAAGTAKSADKGKSTGGAKPPQPGGKQAAGGGTKEAEAKKEAPAVQRSVWQRLWNNGLLIGAAVLALALISMAIFSASTQPPDPAQTPTAVITQVGAVHTTSSGPTTTRPPTAASTAFPAAAAATATEEQAASATPAPIQTPTGGSARIAFASDRSGSVQVWIMDVDNPENRHQVTNASSGACQPTWSPDGTRIAFTTPCKGPSIYYPAGTIKIVDLADGKITDLPVKAPGIGGAFDPAWSPDGETLVYTAVLGEKTEVRAIYLADLSMKTLASQGTKNAQPAWSRDGRHISYIFSNDQNWEALWYMRPNGESKELLAHSERYAEPVWSPDGQHILASMNRGNNIPVLAAIDRSNPLDDPKPLLSGEFRMSRASISPDGNWVTFWTEKGSEKPEIMLASMDGKEVRALTNNSLRDFHPAWSPKEGK